MLPMIGSDVEKTAAPAGATREQPLSPRRLFIGDLDPSVSEEELLRAVEATVGPVRCILKRYGKPFGFATMVEENDYQVALNRGPTLMVRGRQALLQPAYDTRRRR
jgi:hypothetical protein